MRPAEGSRLQNTQLKSIFRNRKRVQYVMFSTLGIGGVMYLMYIVEPFASKKAYKYRGPSAPTVPKSGPDAGTYSVHPTRETQTPHTGMVRGHVEGRAKKTADSPLRADAGGAPKVTS